MLAILLSPAEAGSRLLLICTQRLRAGLMNSAATRLGLISAATERLTIRLARPRPAGRYALPTPHVSGQGLIEGLLYCVLQSA